MYAEVEDEKQQSMLKIMMRLHRAGLSYYEIGRELDKLAKPQRSDMWQVSVIWKLIKRMKDEEEERERANGED